MIRCR